MSNRSRFLIFAVGGALAALAGTVAPAIARAEATIDSRLEATIDRAPAGERLPVLVLLDSRGSDDNPESSPAAVVAGLKRDAAVAQRRIERVTATPDRRFWLVNAVSTMATEREIHALADAPGVAWVGSDQPVRISATADAGGAGSPWDLAQLGVPTAWSTYGVDGSGVRIGSIDTGVDASHPGLAGRVVGWRDFVAGSPTPYDDNGHGTHTIGTMVGRGRGGAALGVAPGATVVVAKVMDAKGYGSGSALIAAAQWIADPDGDPATDDAPDVVNNSWGVAGGDDPWFRPVVRAWVEMGIVPVFAAGNTGPGAGTIASPADYPESLAVGAVDAQRRIASFSARGPVTWSDPDGQGPAAGTPLVKPDVVAPGVSIASTVPGGGEGMYTGTSMAAPHVAGIVALLRQVRPGLAPLEIQDLLRRTAVDLGPAGPDADHGYGLVSAPAALAAAGATPLPASGAPIDDADAERPPSDRRIPVVTLAQIRAGRRIAVRAAQRLLRVERRLLGARRALPIRAPRRVIRVSAAELETTRRIARAVIRRSARLGSRDGGARTQAAPASPPRARLTPGAVRVTDRLARRALAASVRLSRRPAGPGATQHARTG